MNPQPSDPQSQGQQPNPNIPPYPTGPYAPPVQTATIPQDQTLSPQPNRNRFAIIVGSITSLVALLTALLGLFQYLGTTDVPFLGFIHPSETTLLDHARSANIADAHCNISGTITQNSVTYTVTGSGDFTSNPNRSHHVETLSAAGQSITVEDVFDEATNIYYEKSTEAFNDDLWHKNPISSSSSVVSSQALKSFYDLTNPKYIARETIEGRDTYHIQGSITSSNVQIDIWLRADNYYPAKVLFSASGTAVTFDFTSWDTGATIALPSSDQVASN